MTVARLGLTSRTMRIVDHGYAATIHKSQSVTVNHVDVLATPGMDRHAYVVLSRHRDGVPFHFGRDDFATGAKLAAVLLRDRSKDMAADYVAEPEEAARAFADRREIRLPGGAVGDRETGGKSALDVRRVQAEAPRGA